MHLALYAQPERGREDLPEQGAFVRHAQDLVSGSRQSDQIMDAPRDRWHRHPSSPQQVKMHPAEYQNPQRIECLAQQKMTPTPSHMWDLPPPQLLVPQSLGAADWGLRLDPLSIPTARSRQMPRVVRYRSDWLWANYRVLNID